MLIFDEPTQGVDVGAKLEIFALIRELAAEGKGIIVICSDFAELEAVCTRIVVIREGSVAGELAAGEITEDGVDQARVPDRRDAGGGNRVRPRRTVR